MRQGLLGLAALTTVALAVELAVEQPWTQPTQLIAWAALALLALAVGLVWWHPTPRRVRLGQVLAMIVVLSAAVGIWQHVAANYDAGPLDFRYTDTWETLPELTRWWLAATKTVGPSPLLAAGALAQAACASCLRHSVTRSFAVASADQRPDFRSQRSSVD